MARLACCALGLLLVGAAAGAPRPAGAQHLRAAAVGVRSPAGVTERGARREAAGPAAVAPATALARPSRARHVWGGALLGGAAAGTAHVLYIRRQPKGQYHDIGYILVPASVLAGGAVGAGVGYLVHRARAD